MIVQVKARKTKKTEVPGNCLLLPSTYALRTAQFDAESCLPRPVGCLGTILLQRYVEEEKHKLCFKHIKLEMSV